METAAWHYLTHVVQLDRCRCVRDRDRQQAGFGRAEVADIDLVVKAARDAVKVAAINCTRVGAQPPTRAEMQSDWNPGR